MISKDYVENEIKEATEILRDIPPSSVNSYSTGFLILLLSLLFVRMSKLIIYLLLDIRQVLRGNI